MADPIAIYGAITGSVGALGVAWRIFEWWEGKRIRITIKGSVGTVTKTNTGQLQVAQGERFGDKHVMVEVINAGHRPMSLHAAGFVDVQTGHRWQITPMHGQLPKRLDSGEKEIVVGKPGTLIGAIASGVEVMPYCRDGEDHIHIGNNDEHFHRLTRKVRADGAPS